MDSGIVTDSIKVAWERTRTLLLSDRDVGRWLKYGFIAMLGAAAFGGGANVSLQLPTGLPSGAGEFSPPGRIGPELIDASARAAVWLVANIVSIILLALGLLTLWLLLWLVVLFVRSVFRFIFVDAIAASREPGIGQSWFRHTGQGLSLMLWRLLLGLVPLILILIGLVPLVGSIGLLVSGEPLGAVMGAGGLAGLLAALMVAFLLAAVGHTLTDDFLVPAMYVRRCGVFAGWRQVFAAWRGQLGNVILFYLLKLLLGIGAAIAAGIASMLAVMLLVLPALSMGMMLGLVVVSGMEPVAAMLAFGGPALVAIVLGGAVLAYIMEVVLLPVSVILQAYPLAFVGRIDASLRTI